MAMDSIDRFFVIINQNSQNESAADPEDAKKTKKEDSRSEEAVKRRKKQLEQEGKTAGDIEKQLQKDLAEIKDAEQKKARKRNYEEEKAALEDLIEHGATLQEREDAERHLKQLDRSKQVAEAAAKAIESVIAGVNAKFNEIVKTGETYSEYVERIETSLLGTGKGYESVVDKLEKVFAMNVFFSIEDALTKSTEMAEKGIAYNLELRSSLDVFSDKIVKTFDALDNTLTRLVRIQQEDSTQARLGMESLLLNYLNASFQNSEYLQSLYDSVSEKLVEVASVKTLYANEGDPSGKKSSVELEYAIQKWLGSMYSVGVSDSTILALAEGLGYLGSGNVEALTSNSALQQLMAISATRGNSSRSYGEILTSGLAVGDITGILTGFYNLVDEISSSGNIVALNQYAKLFNLSISDITSVLNLTAEDIKSISQDMATYEQTLQQVETELSYRNLDKRSSYSERIKNLEDNLLATIGLESASSLGATLAYMISDIAANILDPIEIAASVRPMGVGASVGITVGDLVRAGVVSTSYLGAILGNLGSLTSALSPNLKALGGEEAVKVEILSGSTGGLNSPTSRNEATYVGRTDDSSLLKSANQQSKGSSSEILEKDVDEEQKKMEKMSKDLASTSDNVKHIVQLLNEYGILVRWYPGRHTQSSDKAAIPLEDQDVQDNYFYKSGGY